MKKKSLVFVLVLVASSSLAQNKILVSASPGVSLYNSENSMKTIGDKSIGWLPGLSVAYENENIWGLNLHFEYNFTRSRIENVIEFIRTNSSGQLLDRFWADFALSMHSIDIAMNQTANEWLSFSIGPTFSFVNRTIAIDEGSLSPPTKLADRLASFCLGVNGSANVQIPFDDNPEYLFFFSSLKLRYLHSLWFDKRGRNVDNYYQSFLLGQLNIGLGYNF